jgi:CheY-like chemotaxis protein
MIEEKIKILIVDDDPFIREVLTAVLEEDYAVVTAENGTEAFDAFNADSGIRLIISDLNMPEIGGRELIKKIRETGSDVPVVILTGNDELRSEDGGADDYLLKDENLQGSVVPSVERVLEKRARR